MENFVLTKETLLSAKTYMPIADKEELAEHIASLCLTPMKTAEQNQPADALIHLPVLYEEDMKLKNIMLMNTLLDYYFGFEAAVAPEGSNPDEAAKYYEEIYDFYAGGHLMNQLERFKGDHEAKNAAFDLLDDFRDFKKIVDTVIYNRKLALNDPLARFSASVALLSTPENIQILADELKKTGVDIADKVAAAKKTTKKTGGKKNGTSTKPKAPALTPEAEVLAGEIAETARGEFPYNVYSYKEKEKKTEG